MYTIWSDAKNKTKQRKKEVKLGDVETVKFKREREGMCGLWEREKGAGNLCAIYLQFGC